MTIAFILEGGQIASQALHKKLGLLPTCSILSGNNTTCAPRQEWTWAWIQLTNSLALRSTILPTITCGKGNRLCHRNSLFQPVQEWLQSCWVALETPIGQGSNFNKTIWVNSITVFCTWDIAISVDQPSWTHCQTWWSRHQIALFRYCSSLTSYNLGSSNMVCIIGRSNTGLHSGFRVLKALFWLEYVSREHTHHPNPKLRQLFPSIAAMFIDTPRKHAALCLVQARHRACTISFQPYLSWLCRDSKIRSSTYTIHMTSGPMKRNGSNLGCFKPQASSFSVMYFQYKHQPDHRPLHHRRNISKKSIPSSCISPRAQNRALNFLISPLGYRLHLNSHVNQIMFDIVTGLYSLTSHAFKASTVAISTSMAFQHNMQLQHNGLCMKRHQQLLHSHRSMQAAMGDKQPPSFTKA